jgi:predicted ATPase
VLFGLWSFYVVRAEHRTAEEIAQNLEHVAETTHDSDLQVEAPLAMGWSCFLKGEFAEARTNLEHVLERYDPPRHGMHAVIYGTEPRVSALACLAETLWFLGDVDQAVRRSDESVALSYRTNHHHSTAHALSIAGFLHAYRGAPDAVLEREEAALRMCQEHGLTFFNTMATILRDWALLAKHPPDLPQAVAQLQQDIAVYEQTGAGLSRPIWQHLLGVACSTLGHVDAALDHAANALKIIEASGERFWEAEVHRLRGDLLLLAGAAADVPRHGPESPETCYERAIATARRQRALSLELHATMRLAQLWEQQNRCGEAYERLISVVGRFTEGHDSTPLVDARALLAELRH